MSRGLSLTYPLGPGAGFGGFGRPPPPPLAPPPPWLCTMGSSVVVALEAITIGMVMGVAATAVNNCSFKAKLFEIG